jgi:hypothetical protein
VISLAFLAWRWQKRGEKKMARRGYSQEKIGYVLKQAEAGIKIGQICREHGYRYYPIRLYWPWGATLL